MTGAGGDRELAPGLATHGRPHLAVRRGNAARRVTRLA
jgi:hypothetical protein